jgi:hypothetical protein
MAEGKTFDIPAAGFEWFKDQMTRIGKRAQKLTGERLFMTVVGFHFEESKDSKFFNQKIMEVFVSCPEPKLAGWEFVARIDHANEAGNIVRTTDVRDLPEAYRTSEPVCDHCGHKRRRRDTFVVFNEAEGFKQVGSSCLKDFLGHGDADKWAKVAELIASLGELKHMAWNKGADGSSLIDHRWIGTEMFLGLCAESILDRGWTSRKSSKETGRDSTADDVWARMHESLPIISENARNLAVAARDWASELDGELSDYEHNIKVVALSEAIEPRSIGIAASIVGSYYARMKPKGAPSTFQGVKGQKLEIEVTVDEVRTLEFSYLHKMRDGHGNRFTWFATKPALKGFTGKTVKIRGTVKDHNEFKGSKSTVLTRVKAL